jgi:hydrogenase maturation protein HypF
MSVLATPRATHPTANAPAPGVRERRRFEVRGVVQGVGFRPFVWNLATRLGLGGWVRNTSGAVLIEVEGGLRDLDSFADTLRAGAPRLARIDAVDVARLDAVGEHGFHI